MPWRGRSIGAGLACRGESEKVGQIGRAILKWIGKVLSWHTANCLWFSHFSPLRYFEGKLCNRHSITVQIELSKIDWVTFPSVLLLFCFGHRQTDKQCKVFFPVFFLVLTTARFLVIRCELIVCVNWMVPRKLPANYGPPNCLYPVWFLSLSLAIWSIGSHEKFALVRPIELCCLDG